MKRRDFVAACLASAGVVAVRAPYARSAADHSPVRLALFDTRYPAAVAFSGTFNRRGVALAPFAGDVTAVWYEQLDPVWRREPISVAGMTTPATLFCLEQLAWDHGLRVAFRGTHDPAPGGGVAHVLEVAKHRPQHLLRSFSEERPWAVQVADHMASIRKPAPAFPSEPEARSACQLRTPASRYDPGTRLVSWLIAPKGALKSA